MSEELEKLVKAVDGAWRKWEEANRKRNEAYRKWEEAGRKRNEACCKWKEAVRNLREYDEKGE